MKLFDWFLQYQVTVSISRRRHDIVTKMLVFVLGYDIAFFNGGLNQNLINENQSVLYYSSHFSGLLSNMLQEGR